jgi:hypothetical protein
MTKVFVSVLLFCFVAQSNAQINNDSMRIQYKNKTFKIGNGITMNGFLLGKNEIQNLMLISPDATFYYKLYLKNKKPATILPIIGLATSITGIFVSKSNKNAGIAMIYGGNIFNVVATLFRKKANINLQNAVWMYNRDVLFPVK